MNINTGTNNLIRHAEWLRGVIICSFGHVDFLLTDLNMRCRLLPEYAEVTSGPSRSLNSTITRTKKLFETTGPLNAYAEEMLALIERIRVYEDARHYIVRGQMVVNTGDTALAPIMFQVYQNGRKDEPEKLKAIPSDAHQLEKLSLEITEYCRQMMILLERINREQFYGSTYAQSPPSQLH
ncbi:hypothetical protein [Pelagibius sp. Alg239-R121]|uniref:hypothetical protein n=1 Tax=Pelagibius sp. Alg239-R121 TaxID=2993448 RepID=UPI0024A63305|nr:hypothetical protein [Pelagibius sp. Alg239-R121]